MERSNRFLDLKRELFGRFLKVHADFSSEARTLHTTDALHSLLETHRQAIAEVTEEIALVAPTLTGPCRAVQEAFDELEVTIDGDSVELPILDGSPYASARTSCREAMSNHLNASEDVGTR